METQVIVAHVVRPFGRHGEVLAEILAPDLSRLAALEQVEAGGRTLRLLEVRQHQGRARLRFAGIERIDQAELLRGLDLTIPRAQRPAAPAGSYYLDDLIGCQVVDRAAGQLGVVSAVRSTGAAELLVVAGARGEILIPFVRAFLERIDLERRRIEIVTPPGLVDLEQAEVV